MGTDPDIPIDDRIGADDDVRADLHRRMDHSGRMNAGKTRGRWRI